MKQAIKNAVIRAAVEWERKYHEHVGTYAHKDLSNEENRLCKAVEAYNEILLNEDVPLELESKSEIE